MGGRSEGSENSRLVDILGGLGVGFEVGRFHQSLVMSRGT